MRINLPLNIRMIDRSIKVERQLHVGKALNCHRVTAPCVASPRTFTSKAINYEYILKSVLIG